MKKHSKTGVESRFQGTVLGHPADPKPVKIEGGSVDSIQDWCRKTRERSAKLAASENQEHTNHVVDSRESSEEVAMMDAQ
jgi:transcription initiation factor TFIID subunit 3